MLFDEEEKEKLLNEFTLGLGKKRFILLEEFCKIKSATLEWLRDCYYLMKFAK